MRRVLLILGVSLALADAASRGAEDAPKPAAEAESVHKELRALRDEVIVAYNARDIDKLITYLDDNVVITWQNATVNKNPQEVKAFCEMMLKGPNRRVESSTIDPKVDSLSHLYSDNKTAVAYGHSNDHYLLIDGTEFDQNTRWSATVVNKNGKWKVACVHISTNMFDNPVLNLAVKKTAWWTGGVAGGTALVLGALGGFLLGRRRKA